MSRFDRMELGVCDFLDVLEETVLMRTEATFELNDGTTFQDRLVDVRTSDGEDYAIFDRHPRTKVREIATISRHELPRTYPG